MEAPQIPREWRSGIARLSPSGGGGASSLFLPLPQAHIPYSKFNEKEATPPSTDSPFPCVDGAERRVETHL